MSALLMVAYHYPPEGGSSGVLRTLKFSKYLPRHGWVPHVLTLRESFYPVRDEGLLRDITPQAVIHRTGALDTARHLAVRGRHLSCLAVPDRFVGWVPFAVARGLRVVRRERIRALYSTSPMASAHLIAAALKRMTGLPWIADFRDPWIEEGLYPTPGSLRNLVERRLERAVITQADRIVVTTPYLRGDFLARYPDLSPEKVRVIYNGYDEADFADLEPPAKGEQFEILHAGLVTPDYRDPAPLLQGVADTLAEGTVARDEIRIAFLGGGAYLGAAEFAELVRRKGLADVVQVLDRVPNREALRRIRQASCLLLLQGTEDTRSLIPAKAFEYLRVGRPILSLTPDGATSELLKDMDHCVVVPPSDQNGLREALVRLYRQWRGSADAIWASRPLQRFERAALTAELAGVLTEVVEGARSPRRPARAELFFDVNPL